MDFDAQWLKTRIVTQGSATVYTLINSVIKHQKQQILKKVILLSSILTLRQCHAAQYHIFRYLLFLMCNATDN